MASYWEFRTILDVNPDGKYCVCVGKTKTGNDCGNPINKSDRSTASRLINQMNKTPNFLDSKADIKQLAELMLCKGVHNSVRYPSQVTTVCEKWTERIDVEFEAILEKEKNAAAMKAKKEARRAEKRSGERRKKLSVYKDIENEPIASVVTEVRRDVPLTSRTRSSMRSSTRLEGPVALSNISTNFSMKRNVPALSKSSLAPPPPPPPSQPPSGTSSPLHLQDFPVPPSANLVHDLPTPNSIPVKVQKVTSHRRKASGSISLFPQVTTYSSSLALDGRRMQIFTSDQKLRSQSSELEGWRKEPVFDFGLMTVPKTKSIKIPMQSSVIVRKESGASCADTGIQNNVLVVEDNKSLFLLDFPAKSSSEGEKVEVVPLPADSTPSLENEVDSLPQVIAPANMFESTRNPLGQIKIMVESVVETNGTSSSFYEVGDMKNENSKASKITSKSPFEVENTEKRSGSPKTIPVEVNTLEGYESLEERSVREDQHIEQEEVVSNQDVMDAELRPDSAVDLDDEKNVPPTSTHVVRNSRPAEPTVLDNVGTEFCEKGEEIITHPPGSASRNFLSIDIQKAKDLSAPPLIPLRSPHRRQESDDNRSLHLEHITPRQSGPEGISIPLRSPYRPPETPKVPTTNAGLEDEKSGYGYAVITLSTRYSTPLPSLNKSVPPPKIPERKITRTESEETFWQTKARRRETSSGIRFLRSGTVPGEVAFNYGDRREKPLPALPKEDVRRAGDGGQGREVCVCGSDTEGEGRKVWKGVNIGIQTEELHWSPTRGEKIGDTGANTKGRRSEGLFGRWREGVVQKFKDVRSRKGNVST